MKIAVGLSGGVDSAVAAFLLKEKGHELIGTIMTLWQKSEGTDLPLKGNACYGPDEVEDIADAKKVCEYLRIPLHTINCAEKYREIVLNNFSTEYISGRTPNPCVLCNQNIKFGVLPALLFSSGARFDYFATGHYVRTEFNKVTGRYMLKRGTDQKKDQSYFLYRLSQEQLSKSIFPLGKYTKPEIRKIAEEAGLPVYEKPESQDFYSGDHRDLIRSKAVNGNIINSEGNILGKHNGIWNYTIGQRKGLGISHTNPLYVISINAGSNEIVLGERGELFSNGLIAKDINIITKKLPETGSAKIRSSAEDVPCSIKLAGDNIKITFRTEQLAVTPGQSVVLYDGETVLGGGIIESSF